MFTEKEIQQIFDSFKGVKVLVIGDVMVDSYLWGRVERISPEAPVPVVSVMKRENRLGGAANVALNLQALGAEPVLCSVTGDDGKAGDFVRLLDEHKLSSAGVIRDSSRPTTTKFRVIGNHTHMLRVDEESEQPLSEELTQRLYNRIASLLEGVGVIVFEDYDKGVVTPELISLVAILAASRSIPVAVDPKRRNFAAYSSITLFKPNFKELVEGLKLGDVGRNREQLEPVITALMKEKEFEMVMVTLSESGIFAAWRDDDATIRSEIIPAHLRSISDVSGAGDTVISVLALGLSVMLKPLKMAALANLAGGLVCEEVGVVPVSRSRLVSEALQKLVTH